MTLHGNLLAFLRVIAKYLLERKVFPGNMKNDETHILCPKHVFRES
jgi:hypothetical protein